LCSDRCFISDCGHAIGDGAVVYRAQIHGRHVLQVWIEDHVPGHTVVFFDVAQRVLDTAAIEARPADGVQQRVHRVVGQRSKLLRLLVEASFEAVVNVQPAWVPAGWIIRKYSLEPLSRRASFGQQRGPQRAVGAKDALFHPRSPHLLEDFGRLSLVSPQHNGIGPRRSNHSQLFCKFCVAWQVQLLDDDRVTQPPRCIA
jgi:hypothetical protein